MKLHCLLQERRAASSRYRALQYLPALEARGWSIAVDTVPRTGQGRTRLLMKARRADVVLLQRKRLPGWQLRLLASAGARIVYDVDDAVWLRSSRHANPHSDTRLRRFSRSVAAADLVLAGNEYIAETARALGATVVVQPLSFDVAQHPRHSASAPDAPLRIGWIGGAKSLSFLAALAEPLLALQRELEQAADARACELVVVCNRPLEIPGLRCRHVEWSEADEREQVARFDIGLAPLPDDEWARGKCATKLLQCMAAAVPCVASAVGVHETIIEDGANGRLARTPEDWTRALRELANDAALRERLGAAGRETVARDFDLAHWAAELDRALRGEAASD